MYIYDIKLLIHPLCWIVFGITIRSPECRVFYRVTSFNFINCTICTIIDKVSKVTSHRGKESVNQFIYIQTMFLSWGSHESCLKKCAQNIIQCRKLSIKNIFWISYSNTTTRRQRTCTANKTLDRSWWSKKVFCCELWLQFLLYINFYFYTQFLNQSNNVLINMTPLIHRVCNCVYVQDRHFMRGRGDVRDNYEMSNR